MKKILLENLNVSENPSNNNDYFINEDHLTIKNATIIDFTTFNIKGKLSGGLIWLCESENDKLFLLNTLYFVSEEEISIIDLLFLNKDHRMIGSKIETSMLMNRLPVLYTDMKFVYDSDDCVKLDSILTNGTHMELLLSINLFASFKHMDYCINNLDFTNIRSSITSAFSTTENTDVVIVDYIDSIISTAIMDRDNCAVAFEVSAVYILENGKCKKESFTILGTFNLGIKLKKKLFKDNKLDIILNLPDDEDKYLADLFFINRFKNIDKEYICIKAKNKNKVSKLFLFDSAMKVKLEEMIKSSL